MKTNRYDEAQTITLAQLCEALANGDLPAELEEGMYVVRGGDLRRLARTSTPDLLFLYRQARNDARKAS